MNPAPWLSVYIKAVLRLFILRGVYLRVNEIVKVFTSLLIRNRLLARISMFMCECVINMFVCVVFSSEYKSETFAS